MENIFFALAGFFTGVSVSLIIIIWQNVKYLRLKERNDLLDELNNDLQGDLFEVVVEKIEKEEAEKWAGDKTE